MASGLQQAGVRLVSEAPDLAVIDGRDGRFATTTSAARSVIALGRGGRRALRGRRIHRRFVALPDPLEPHVIIPADRPRVASYAIRTWGAPQSRARRLRNEVAIGAISARVFPELPRSIGLSADAAPPFMIAASEPLGVDPASDWFLTLGLGDALTRAAYQLFPPGEDQPRWVLKFSRVGGHTDPFERDERGLALAAQAGGVVAAHAPALLGRFDVAGLPASVESAAIGTRVTNLLQSPGRRREKLRFIDAIAAWCVAIGRQTAVRGSALDPERRRIEADVLPRWLDAGVSADLTARIGDVPAVLQHNDLGCWNIVAGARGFTAVDWESSREHGLPLWDLLYFLVDALVHLDGAWARDRREAHAARLLRGEEPSSAILFRWVREAVESLDIPDRSVGPIVTLGWLHHGLSGGKRTAAADELAPGLSSTETYGDWMPRVWMHEPGLGVDWVAWSG